MGGRSAQERRRQPYPAFRWCGWEFSAIPALPRPGGVLEWTGCLGWPAFKPGGCMKVSSTTWSWAAIVISPAGPRRHISGSWVNV